MAAKEDESSTERVWAAGFHYVGAWRAFLNLWTVYFFNFPIFFSGRGQPRITETVDTESVDTAVHLQFYKILSSAHRVPLRFLWFLERIVS